MACTHAAGCPLFPHLNASLQGWRDYYCDSTDRWQTCARYKLSLTGERVPISLLPNGHRASHLAGPPEPDPSDGAGQGQAPQWAGAPGHGTDGTGQFETAPRPRRDRPVHVPQSHDGLARHTRRAPQARRGLVARIVHWMRGAA